MEFNKTYWEELYISDKTGWDVGYVTTPLKEYIDQLTDTSIKILVPGAGNGYEAEYLYNKGFKNTYILEYAEQPIHNLLKRTPDFPKNQIIKEDFFEHSEQYDLIIEHTFFSSILPKYRTDYVTKMHQLLKNNGKLVGLLFNIDFKKPFPPFGGNRELYIELFKDKFEITILETAYNSIKPRANNELFFLFTKKS